MSVRNSVADCASSVCQRITAAPHTYLRAAKAKFLVHHYWRRSESLNVCAETVFGCLACHGYDRECQVLTEQAEDVNRLQGAIKNVLWFCACKGECNTQICSFKRKSSGALDVNVHHNSVSTEL